ncbi:hypothetical protein BP6252_08583 [Coleophoma cylindrospora]|uniref:Uncharacterized protein n=1 Tax=Coleophoma cylindrospora TaxID=1849047 RepID=A0A3D8R699_9HELO|nr:hypothetical protein BP6252_08583 [Coleophoma cylindrospora]
MEHFAFFPGAWHRTTAAFPPKAPKDMIRNANDDGGDAVPNHRERARQGTATQKGLGSVGAAADDMARNRRCHGGLGGATLGRAGHGMAWHGMASQPQEHGEHCTDRRDAMAFDLEGRAQGRPEAYLASLRQDMSSSQAGPQTEQMKT